MVVAATLSVGATVVISTTTGAASGAKVEGTSARASTGLSAGEVDEAISGVVVDSALTGAVVGVVVVVVVVDGYAATVVTDGMVPTELVVTLDLAKGDDVVGGNSRADADEFAAGPVDARDTFDANSGDAVVVTIGWNGRAI